MPGPYRSAQGPAAKHAAPAPGSPPAADEWTADPDLLGNHVLAKAGHITIRWIPTA